VANSIAAYKTVLNNRDIWVLPSVTMPDDIIMNDVKYPADEIKNSFMSLDQTPAPMGHPLVDGKFVSASHPLGLNLAYAGAWNSNPRQKNGRVFMDKMVDIEVAQQSEKGRRLLNAIEQGEPIHTSTGLYCWLENSENADHKFIARGIKFDHDAILLDEEGAATPEKGVGIFVNREGSQEVSVINSSLNWDENGLDWAGLDILNELKNADPKTAWENITLQLKALFHKAAETTETTETGDLDMTTENPILKQILDQINTVAASVATLATTVGDQNVTTNAALKTVTDDVTTLTTAHNAAAELGKAAELKVHSDAAAKVVKAGLLPAEAAAEAPIGTLNALINTIKDPKKATPLNAFGGASTDDTDEFASMDLNAHFDDKKTA
jgi:hypothetical protein